MKIKNIQSIVTFNRIETESPLKRVVRTIARDIDNLNTAQGISEGIFIR